MQENSRNPNWFSRLINLEKCLIIIFVMLANEMAEEFKTGALASGRGKSQMQHTAENAPGGSQSKRIRLKFCTSEEHKRTATEVMSRMNQKVQPCDDFYEFACGNYIKNTKIPADAAQVDELFTLNNQVGEQLKEIISTVPSTKQILSLKLPHLLYTACMNEKDIEALSVKHIKEISESLGGWPVIVGRSWDSANTWNWMETVKQFRRLGFNTNILVNLMVTVDPKGIKKHIITLDQFIHLQFRDDSSYHKNMVDVAVLLGAEPEAAEKELQDSLKFELQLKSISVQAEDMHNPNNLYNPRTITQLQKSYPYVQWLDYIRAFLPKNIIINENKVINVATPSYFEKLGKLLSVTNKRVIANYVMWRMHEDVLFALPEKFRKTISNFGSSLQGQTNQRDRQMDCVLFVSNWLPISTGSLYVRKYFQRNSKEVVAEMFNNIRDTFSKTIDEVDWIDGQNTRKEAKKKLLAMPITVGYTDLWDDNNSKKFHAKLKIDPNKFLQSLLNLNIFIADKQLNNLRLPPAQVKFMGYLAPHIVNSVYRYTTNTIEIPAVHLQGYSFNACRPKYMNYGAIGSLFGHQITLALDHEGRRFGPDGNLFNWWNPNTEKAFYEKAKCVVEQYNNYKEKETGLSINGEYSQGINIADNGGFKQSYKAYNEWVSRNGNEPSLPGLKYSPKQMFWISAAQRMCTKYRKETIELLITTGKPPPAEIRVSGAFKNIEDFAIDFKCPVGSPMNPAHKCKVW